MHESKENSEAYLPLPKSQENVMEFIAGALKRR